MQIPVIPAMTTISIPLNNLNVELIHALKDQDMGAFVMTKIYGVFPSDGSLTAGSISLLLCQLTPRS